MVSVNVALPKSQAITSPVSISPKRVAFSTLGCKVNTFETELIAEKLIADNYQRVDSTGQADLYVINSCTVTAEADRQARQIVRRAVRQNPDAWVVVTGCYAEMSPEVCSQIPGVDLVVGNSQKLDIPELLESLYDGNLSPILMRDIDKEISLPDQLLHGFEGRSRGFVQIQQGCDQGCTFCIIHTARGPNRSFSAEMIKRQCQRLIMNGYGELVLCGVDIGSYGSDFAAKDFGLVELVKDLLELEGEFRIRLSSIDPAHISDEFIELMASNHKICPQLHLSLQSANTLILKRMKRRATRELIYDRIKLLRRAQPELVISADIMVGFPTETDEHFQDTLSAITELEIAYPHVFMYSPRPGTPAARIPYQVPKSVRKKRAEAARLAGSAVWKQLARDQIGKRVRVLLEHDRISSGDKNRRLFGRQANYFPVSIMIDDSTTIRREQNWLDVEITGCDNDSLFAKI